MAYVKTITKAPDFVQIPNWFITDYMPKALGGYTKVYLYMLALSFGPQREQISLEDVSKTLNVLSSEVIQSLNYWHEQKVLSFNMLDEENFELEFYTTAPQSVPEAPKAVSVSKPIISQTRPEYRTEEINVYLKDSHEVAQLFKLAEQYLGRLLTITDQKIIFSLYDWLHMPFDLIEYLIEYCVGNNHKAIHYIEKVAINWVDEGILTLEQAKAKTLSDKRYFKILSSLGSSKATLTPAEKKCMSKWLDTYKFSMDIILEACKRTVMQTNKPSLNYVDSILSAWHTERVTSLEDVLNLDKAHESKKILAAQKQPTSAISNKIAKFNSMYSHDYDFDALEKLQEEHITRKLNGGN